jgi:hypothetical protein
MNPRSPHYFSIRLTLKGNSGIKHMFIVNTVQQQNHMLIKLGHDHGNILTESFSFIEFWADLDVYIIKLHFNGYSCKELSLECNSSNGYTSVPLKEVL